MLLSWVVVVLTHHGVRGERQSWYQRSVIPVHNRDDAEQMANVIRNMDPIGEHYSTEVCIQIPAQKGNVLLTVHAVEELINEWEKDVPKVTSPRIGPKLKFSPKPYKEALDEDEPA